MKKISVLLSLCVFVCSILCSSQASAVDPVSNDHKHFHSAKYGSFYTMNESVVAPEHAIPFERETVCSKGIEHPAGSGDFIIKEPGIYRVTYSVSLKEDKCQYYLQKDKKEEHERSVALSLNGHVICGSEMFVGESDHLSTMSLLVKVCGKNCCDYVLNIINNNPLVKGWHNIHLQAGSCNKDVTASIVIEKVAECSSDCCCKS